MLLGGRSCAEQEERGWLDPQAELPSEERIQETRRRTVSAEAATYPLEAFRQEIPQRVEPGRSYVVMHQLVRDRCSCSDTEDGVEKSRLQEAALARRPRRI
jgi:hypothetical protein